MKMNKKILIKDGKEIVIAASAAISLGAGTSLTHQVLAKAADITTTSTETPTTTSSSTVDTSTNNKTNTTDSASSQTITSETEPNTTSTTTQNPTTDPVVTSTNTNTASMNTTAAPTTSAANTNTANTASVAGTTNAGTTGTATNNTPVTTTPNTAPTTSSTTSTVTTSSTEPSTTTNSSTGSTTDQTTTVTPPTSDTTTTTPAPAASEYTPSDYFTWSTDATTGTATVTGLAQGASVSAINLPPSITLDGVTYKVTAIGNNAFQFNNDITSITLNDGLTTIGSEAFYSNQNLASVIFNDGLESIGEGAFAYDSKLATVDFSKNTTLQTIGDNAFVSNPIATLVLPDSVTSIGKTAFAYNNALTSLTLPQGLQTIGDQAFASNNNLQEIVFNKALTTIGYQSFIYNSNLTTLDFTNATNLQSIGAGAFEYDKISGNLTFPASVTSVGDQAFLSNQITGLSYAGKTLSIGDGVFKYNRIVNINVPNLGIPGSFGSEIGGYQVSTIFTDPSHDNISDFFNINADGFGEQYLGIFGLTNGVTYSNGVFNIPTGTTSFSFNWSIGPEYNGQYNVVLNNPVIKAIDSVSLINSSWSPSDNFISCILQDGTNVPLSSMKISVVDPSGQTVSTVDTSKAGIYQVTYSYGAYSTTVNVNVQKYAGSYTLSGTNSSVYNGKPQDVTGSYQVVLSNGVTYTTQPGDVDFVTAGATNAGTYQVQLSAQGIAAINTLQGSDTYDWEPGTNTATFVINKLPITISAVNASKESGESDPDLTASVSNGVTDADYTVTRATGETVGTYPITVNYNDDANPNYSITVQSGTFTITGIDGSDFTMKVGDPTPTVADFNASAYDINGPVSEISLDLNGADLSQNGDYTVTLSTPDGMTKQVVLHVTGGSNNNNNGSSTGNPDDNQNGGDNSDNQGNQDDEGNPDDQNNQDDEGNSENTDDNNEDQTTDSDGNQIDEEVPKDTDENGSNNTETVVDHNQGGSATTESSTNSAAVKPTNNKYSAILRDNGYRLSTPNDSSSERKLITVSSSQSVKQTQTNPEFVSKKGRFPQTGDNKGIVATISGILIGLLLLVGIDLKRRKNNR